MGLTSDLTRAPYFDDYDPEKNYHRILFKPSVAVQARELTQLQTILQDQIERFGENIIREGSIVKGGNFTEIPGLSYVKILDNNENGQPVTMQNYAGCNAVGLNSGVRAYIRATLPGLESQSPDLNTLFVKYTSTGNQDNIEYKTFIQGESVQIFRGSDVVDTIVVATSDVDSAPMGMSYAVTCGDGIIFQKGHFVRFSDQLAIVSKYNNVPDKVVVGFYTDEQLVDSNSDTTLLDNAEGAHNYAAPGADRLKLTPTLVVYGLDEAKEDEHFLSIQEYSEGRVIRKNTETQYATIAKEFEKRTAEESGDYTVKDFNVTVREHIDPDNLNVVISSGLGYVGGKRVETIGPTVIAIKKGVDVGTVSQQDILGGYGNYVVVADFYGHLDASAGASIELKDNIHALTGKGNASAAGNVIGSAKVMAVTKDSGSRFRFYLSDIKMQPGSSFDMVKSVQHMHSAGVYSVANLVLENNKAVIKDSSFVSKIFPIGRSAIRSVETDGSDYVLQRTSTGSVGTSGVFDISLSGDQYFPFGGGVNLNSDARAELILTNTITGEQMNITSAVTSADAKAITITVSPAPGTTTGYTVTYPVKRVDVRPTGKAIGTYYVRLDGNKHRYSLGMPDVIDILDVWEGTGTSFTDETPGIKNVRDRFVLDTGQTLEYYGLSYLEKRASYSIPSGSSVLVKLRAFTEVTTGSYSKSFFSVNSYPVDDTSEVLPDNKIRTQQIPNFIGPDGASYDLRDCLDFRPFASNTAARSITVSGAPLNPSEVMNFAGDRMLIAPNKNAEVTYTYYQGRVDRVILSTTGEFIVLSGDPSDNPYPPSLPQVGMHLANLNIPPYPSLPSAIAARENKENYSVVVTKIENKRYTMRDIGRIERRISSLEYYTALNSLEKSAQDMVITDSNGLDRFKNGIICDNFSDLMVADTKSIGFAASVDPAYSELSPSFRKHDLKLKLLTSTHLNTANGRLCLPYDTSVVEEQMSATTYRNCTTDFYKWFGDGSLYPAYDEGYDSVRAPDIVMNVDLATPFAEYSEALSQFVPLQTANSTSRSSSTSSRVSTALSGGRTQHTTTTVTNRTTTTTTTSLEQNSSAQTQEVGDFVTDIRFSPFMRGNIIRVFVQGLRPNTRFHFFFDGINVDAHMAKGILDGEDIIRTSDFGNQDIKSDNRGNLIAVFKLPENTFYVGDRELLVMDVATIKDGPASTSSATMMYRAYNYSVEKSGLYLSVDVPEFKVDTNVSVDMTQTVTTRTVISSPPSERRGSDPGGGPDPISQTFTVSPGFTDTSHMFLSGLDLYFQSKSTTNGVVIEIRDVVNGYPGTTGIPGTKVILQPDQVSVSSDGTVPTEVRFPSPVALKTNTSYVMVIRPIANDPDYRVWVSKTGQKDVVTGMAVNSDTASGTLFTSTNDQAWTPYQDENLKYRLYKATFDTSSTGTATFGLDDYEFFKLSAGNPDFIREEVAYVVKGAVGAGSISVQEGSPVVNGVGTSFVSMFTVGDYIAVQNETGISYSVGRIKHIVSNTELRIDGAFTVSLVGRPYYRAIAGIVDYANASHPATLHIRKSSAKIGNTFDVGDMIVGAISGATATIGEIYDLPISYCQINMIKSMIPITKVITDFDLSTGPRLGYSYPIKKEANTGENVYIPTETVAISRTNEINNFSGGRRFGFNVGMLSMDKAISPLVNADIMSISTYQYLINDADIDSESIDEGLADARYITRTVTLADGMDAEDLRVYVTGYRPSGSDIHVFGKFKSAEDGSAWKNTPWTRMRLTTSSNFRSLSTNRDDFREFEYRLGEVIVGNGEGAYLNNGNFEYKNSEGAIFTNYKQFAIKVVMTAQDANLVPRLRDIRGIALT